MRKHMVMAIAFPAIRRSQTKPVGEPDAGNPHVRFDERGWETERRHGPSYRAHPRLYRRSPPEAQARYLAFQQGLQQLGWTDGRNVHIDTRWGAGNAVDIRKYATELVALAPEVILKAACLWDAGIINDRERQLQLLSKQRPRALPTRGWPSLACLRGLYCTPPTMLLAASIDVEPDEFFSKLFGTVASPLRKRNSTLIFLPSE
jgi:hypothetical protein